MAPRYSKEVVVRTLQQIRDDFARLLDREEVQRTRALKAAIMDMMNEVATHVELAKKHPADGDFSVWINGWEAASRNRALIEGKLHRGVHPQVIADELGYKAAKSKKSK